MYLLDVRITVVVIGVKSIWCLIVSGNTIYKFVSYGTKGNQLYQIHLFVCHTLSLFKQLYCWQLVLPCDATIKNWSTIVARSLQPKINAYLNRWKSMQKGKSEEVGLFLALSFCSTVKSSILAIPLYKSSCGKLICGAAKLTKLKFSQ